MFTNNGGQPCVKIAFLLLLLGGNLYGANNLTGMHQSSRKHMKSYKQYIKNGNAYMAACHLLDACSKKDNAFVFKGKKKYLKRLEPIAGKAFKMQLEKVDKARKEEAFVRAHEQLLHLQRFLQSIQSHAAWMIDQIDDAPFSRVDRELQSAKSAAAQQFHQKGKKHFDQRRWREALKELNSALEYKANYPEVKELKAASLYNMAEEKLATRQYGEAASLYLKSKEVLGIYRDAEKKACEIIYQMARHYDSVGYHRAAHGKLQFLSTINGNYKDASRLKEAYFQKAKTAIGFKTFQNKTSNSVAGIAIGDYLFQEIKEYISSNASAYVVLSNDPARSDFYFEGAATQVHAQTRGPHRTRKDRQVTWSVKNGKDQEGKTRYVDVSRILVFEEYKLDREVAMAGYVNLIENKTKKHIFSEQISKRNSRSAHWAEKVSFDGPDSKIPSEIQRLLNSSNRSVMPESQMFYNVLDDLANSLGSLLLSHVDKARDHGDPVSLALDFASKENPSLEP